MMFPRRTFLGAGALATLWTAFGSKAALAVPALEPDGFRLIEAGPASAKVAPGAGALRGLGYDGQTPGPVLRLRLGDELKLRLLNNLDLPTTLDWPGLRIANSSAGIGDLTQPPVGPGGRFDCLLRPPDAGFALYRPHGGKEAGAQISRGLYGPIVIEETLPPQVDLEAIVALQDWRLDHDGGLDESPLKPGEARLGDVIGANGALAPLALSPPPRGRVRLRLANASVARIMIIAIEGLKPTIIAIDGQPSEPFEPLRNQFPMGPGARFELMFDMPHDLGATVRFVLKGGEASPIPDEPDRPVLIFTATGEPAPARPPFPGLPANPLLPKEIDLARARRVDVAFAGGGGRPITLDGETPARPWPDKPLFKVAKGSPVTLGLVNNSSMIQPIQIGGHVARLLHPLDDGWEPYWRDNVLIAPGKTAHVAFVADNPGRWPIESADPDLAAAGLRTFFEVA
jgi:FtsP/CotA-like multicopper oxidase with cupredoxin domain